MTEWLERSWWGKPGPDTEAVANRLDVQSASVRRYLTEHTTFPEPAEQRGGRNYWTPASIYRYIWATKPRLRERVPRLCPLTDDLAPAQFVESEVVETHGVTFVLHTWEPSDGRGQLGIGYPIDFQPFPLGNETAPERLLSLRPHLSAAVVPKIAPGLFHDDAQPLIFVADRAGLDWYPWEIGWFDLVALLRVDLPWWSYGLTDLSTMSTWTPAATPLRVRPRVLNFSAARLEQCRPHDGSHTDQAIATLVDYLDQHLADTFGLTPTGHDTFPPAPGLTHAATAAISDQRLAPPPPAIIRQALSHRIDDRRLGVDAVFTARTFDALLPVITSSILKIDRDDCTRLAHEWCHRLIPAAPAERTELGYHWVQHVIETDDDGRTPQEWWRDPLNPDVWAISDTDGTVYASIGCRMPARGRLEEVAIASLQTFFRDSAGNPYPIPAEISGLHTCGYDGGGSTRLTAAILTLMTNADGDVYHNQLDALDCRATGLYDAVSSSRTPTTLNRTQLETLTEETPHGAARRAFALRLSGRFSGDLGKLQA